MNNNFNFDCPVVSGFQSHITVNESETRSWFNEDGISNPFGSNYINPMDPQFNNCCSDSRRNMGNNMNVNNPIPMNNCYPGSNFGFIAPELNGSFSNATSSFFDDAPINNFITNPINNVPTPIETNNIMTATINQPIQNQNNNVGGLNSIVESRRNMNLTTVNNSNTVSNPWSSTTTPTTSIANTIPKPCCSEAFSNPYGITVTDPYEVNKMIVVDDAKKGVAGRWNEELVARIPLEQPKVDWNNTSTQAIDSLKDESINKNATWVEIAEKNFKK